MRVKAYKNANNNHELWLVEDFNHAMYSDTSKVMPVFWFEDKLEQGRFKRFVHEKQRYVIERGFPLSEQSTIQKVEWIAENVENPWNLTVARTNFSEENWKSLTTGMRNGYDGTLKELHYSFAAQRDAALFLMLFDESRLGVAD